PPSPGLPPRRVSSIGRSFLHLAVDVLQRALHLLGLAMEPRVFVAGHPSKTFFHLAANIFGAATEAIVSHEVILLRFALPTAAVGIGSMCVPKTQTRT